jgi:hypothetical protein
MRPPLEDEELDRIRNQYEMIAERARAGLRAGRCDTGAPKAPEVEDEEES